MNELRRMAYLDALGIDSYVSRAQLPGAAVTQRLAIASRIGAAEAGKSVELSNGKATFIPPRRQPGGTPVERAKVGRDSDSSLPEEKVLPRTEAVPRFSLTAIVAGDWLWLEELTEMPLTTEQVRLVQAMAQALRLSQGAREQSVTTPTRPLVTQFDWPIHTNYQLDLGSEAARASVAAFAGRKLEQHGCGGLVLLGQACALRVPVQEMNIPSVITVSTAEIIANPALKRQVWRELLQLLRRS